LIETRKKNNMKYYENVANELDNLLIDHSNFIKKRYKLNSEQMHKVIENWSLGISIRYLESNKKGKQQ
tara:strand:+ start:3757 stop:3960 length:204 start_codon:yes stop_codon:yes gene_type:complete